MPFLALYLLLVPHAYLQVVVLIATYSVTALLFKPICIDFVKAINNYKTLEKMEPATLIGPMKELQIKARGDLQTLLIRIRKREGAIPIKELLHAYLEYVPSLLYGVVFTIIKQGGPHLKNSIAALTFLCVFILLPSGFNVLVIAYLVLTLLFWFWAVSVVFVGFPQNKIDIELKNGQLYKDMYKVEDNPNGYCLYLDSTNQILNIKKDEVRLEKIIDAQTALNENGRKA
jgi:hypothetical protein